MILTVPAQFRPKDLKPYPSHQKGLLLEEYASRYFQRNLVRTSRIYAPIYWTAYHRTTDYGKGLPALKAYWQTVKAQNSRRKFWTVCQYDDSTLLNDPDLLTFCAGGNVLDDEPVPLLCDAHPSLSPIRNPSLLAGFIGGNTHPIRRQLHAVLSRSPGFSVTVNGIDGAGQPSHSRIGTQPALRYQPSRINRLKRLVAVKAKFGTDSFLRLMADCKFSLCPRGYGPTSFRLYESLQLGVVPVYISDRFWLPFTNQLDWERFAVLVPEHKIEQIPEILRSISDQRRAEMKAAGREAWDNYLCMSSTCRHIAAGLEKEQHCA